jgi:hypothetical protein
MTHQNTDLRVELAWNAFFPEQTFPFELERSGTDGTTSPKNALNDLPHNNNSNSGTGGTAPRPCGTKAGVWGVPFPTFPLEGEGMGEGGQGPWE